MIASLIFLRILIHFYEFWIGLDGFVIEVIFEVNPVLQSQIFQLLKMIQVKWCKYIFRLNIIFRFLGLKNIFWYLPCYLIILHPLVQFHPICCKLTQKYKGVQICITPMIRYANIIGPIAPGGPPHIIGLTIIFGYLLT